MDKDILITILSYSRFNYTELDWLDKLFIHQHIYQKTPLAPSLMHKIQKIISLVKYEKWRTPEYRYNASREIEIFNAETEKWLIFNK